jgi:hypothetical protein
VNGLLQHAPTTHELERLYHELAQLGAPSVGRKRPWAYRPQTPEALVALAGEMLRYDPRLLSILLQLVLRHWHELNPLTLRAHLHQMRWPQALLVVLEFARLASGDPELKYFCDHLAAGFARVEPSERFFLDAERPASRMSARHLGRNLGPYARWGFMGHERPTADAATKRTVGRYDARTRRQILDEQIEKAGQTTLADYLEAVDHAISRQQALLDLKAHPQLRVEGHGRGALWRRVAQRGAGRKRAG